MRIVTFLTAIICLGWTVKAQDSLRTVQLDEVVITGTKSPIPVEKSGKTIFKLTRKEIESSGGRTVADVLNTVPGVQMDGNFGPMGTNIDYFVRGASSKRTLILIDGMPFNDASGIDQTYDLRFLDLNQVESIEVLKGGLSTLYGSGAAAGVINITLKKPAQKTLNGSVGVDYGSFNTLGANGAVSGTKNKVSYLFNGGYKSSDGFSGAQDIDGSNNFDDDGYEGFNLLGKTNYQISNAFNLGVTISYDDFNSDFDSGAFTDSETNNSDYSQIRAGILPSYKWDGGKIEGKLFINKVDRTFESFGSISDYDAKSHQADIYVDQNLRDNLKLIGGINYQRMQYANQPDFEVRSFSMIDPYLTLIYDENNFNVQLGGRLNQHSDYGSNYVYNVNPSYLISGGTTDFKVITSYATAFITPSLFQLFGPFGANPDLNPESSESAEGGFSILNEGFNFEMVYYYRKDDDLIIYTTQYENSTETIETNGVELNGSYRISDRLSLSGNYTYTHRLNDQTAFRIPEHKYGASIRFEAIPGLQTALNYLHTGSRDLQYFDNTTFNVVAVDAEAFDLVDFTTSYQWNGIRISASINNVFDEEFQAIAGFNSIGRNYQAGISYNF